MTTPSGEASRTFSRNACRSSCRTLSGLEDLLEERLPLLLPDPLGLQAREHLVEQRDEGVQLGRAGRPEARAELARAEELGAVAERLHRRGKTADEERPGERGEDERGLRGEEPSRPIAQERDGEEGQRGVKDEEVEERAGRPAHGVIPYFSSLR